VIDDDETLVRIVAPHFVAGIVVKNDRVVAAADVVRYMERRRWTADDVRAYVARKGWKATIVPRKYYEAWNRR